MGKDKPAYFIIALFLVAVSAFSSGLIRIISGAIAGLMLLWYAFRQLEKEDKKEIKK